MAPEEPVQLIKRQLDAYSARKIEAYLTCFAPGVRLEVVDGERLLDGADAVAAQYRPLFAGNPRLRASLLDRISVGDYVIDEELVEGLGDGGTSHLAVISRIVDGQIAGVRVLRSSPADGCSRSPAGGRSPTPAGRSYNAGHRVDGTRGAGRRRPDPISDEG